MADKRFEFDPDSDWADVIRLAYRPAWSIRSRQGSLAPLLQAFRTWRRKRRMNRSKKS
jgi:hypothetical protein